MIEAKNTGAPMTDENNIKNQENAYSNLNIPNLEELYKAEAQRLLKSINEQMEYYYKKSILKNVDALELYQVAQKINKFESNVPGIDILKQSLSDDVLAAVAYIEKEYRKKCEYRTSQIITIQDELNKLEKQNRVYIFLIILFQWYLYPKYQNNNNRIKELEYELKSIEIEESKEKRASLNTEQLIKMSHIFREKYLNIPIPTSQN